MDLHVKERTLDAKYHALNSAEGVRLLLGDYNALVGRQYCGDYDAVVILADLETAIERAGLTDRQRQALRLVYLEDLTQEKAGEAMGLDKQGVNNLLDRATESIAEIYYYWCGHNEGYTTTITLEEAE